MSRLLLGLLFLFAPGGPAHAQETPRAAAEQYVDAVRGGDWGRASRLMHPAALAELKNLLGTLAMADSAGQVLQPLFGVRTSAEFDALPAVEIYARLTSRAAAASPEARAALQAMRVEIVGEVVEGDTVHVVYRVVTRLEEVSVRRMDVMSFRRHDGRWLALLTSDLRGMAISLARALGAPAPE